jgi:hypothetical protein
MVTELDSDAHSSEDKDISAQSISDRVTLLTQTSHSGITTQTVDLVYTGSQWVTTEAPHINKGSSQLSVFML